MLRKLICTILTGPDFHSTQFSSLYDRNTLGSSRLHLPTSSSIYGLSYYGSSRRDSWIMRSRPFSPGETSARYRFSSTTPGFAARN